MGSMKRSYVMALLLTACGGNVVVDSASGSGTTGTGGHIGHNGPTGVGAGTGAGGAATATCQTDGCSANSDGSCACKGTCSDGTTVSAACKPGGGECTCSVKSPNLSSVSSCSQSGQGNPCDLVTGCCAQFF
jgi:hypothetical protein